MRENTCRRSEGPATSCSPARLESFDYSLAKATVSKDAALRESEVRALQRRVGPTWRDRTHVVTLLRVFSVPLL